MKLIAAIIAFVFSLLGYSQNFTSQKGGNCFSLEIPNYMTKTFELNENASLQYHNTGKETYVIVLEDTKEELQSLGLVFESAKDFLNDFVSTYQTEATNRIVSEIIEFESNGNKCAQLEMSFTNQEVDFFMVVTSVESSGYFYNILCWTLLEFKDTFKNDFYRIAKSLRE